MVMTVILFYIIDGTAAEARNVAKETRQQNASG